MIEIIPATGFIARPLFFCLLLPHLLGQKTTPTPLERLQAKLDVVSVTSLTTFEFAGQYVNPSDELRKRVPPMGSAKLFVFPDRTYIFTVVTDIPPDTIPDKGTWTLDGDTLRLKSDRDVTWKPHVERQYLLVRRRGHSNELFLLGLQWSLPYFEKNANRDPEFQFLLGSLKRERVISSAETESLKKSLIAEKWRPEFYRSARTRD